MARHDFRHGGHGESRNAKHASCIKASTTKADGHVIRMPDERLPKKVFYGELQEGKCSQGDQKKHYKDTLKATLKDFDIPIGSREQAAQEQLKWRGFINKRTALYEKRRESVKLKESADNAKPIPMDHQLIP